MINPYILNEIAAILTVVNRGERIYHADRTSATMVCGKRLVPKSDSFILIRDKHLTYTLRTAVEKVPNLAMFRVRY